MAADDGGDDRGPGGGSRESAPAASHPRSPIPDPLKQLLHEPERRLRRCVAPVEPSVYGDRHIVSMGERDRGEEVLVEGVQAAVAGHADEVERGTTLFHAAAQLAEGWRP